MKRQLETQIEAQPEVQLECAGVAESAPKLLNAPDLLDAAGLLTTNDAGLLATTEADVAFAKWDAVRTQAAQLRKLRLLWAKRELILYWALAGFCAAVLVALVIPKQYVSVARLLPPESLSAAGGFGSIAGGLIGVSNSGSLLVALMRSRTVEDRMIERFHLKQVYRVELQQDAYTRLQKRTTFSLEAKNGIVVLSVADGDPQRAAAMAGGYVEELVVLMTKLNNSSAHRERVFLQDRLQSVKVEMETAEKDFSEFSSKNGMMDIAEQGRVMIDRNVKLRGRS